MCHHIILEMCSLLLVNLSLTAHILWQVSNIEKSADGGVSDALIWDYGGGGNIILVPFLPSYCIYNL